MRISKWEPKDRLFKDIMAKNFPNEMENINYISKINIFQAGWTQRDAHWEYYNQTVKNMKTKRDSWKQQEKSALSYTRNSQ